MSAYDETAGADLQQCLDVLQADYERDLAFYERDLAFNARLFELARHNGYSTDTYNTGRHLCWTVPDQLIGVAGYQCAVLT